jgi:hypothetical protein
VLVNVTTQAAGTFTSRPAAFTLVQFHIGSRTGPAMTDDNSKEAAAAFIAALLRNLFRKTEAHKDLAFLGYLMETAREEAENQAG